MGTSVICMATTHDTSLGIAATVSAALREAGISQRDAATRTGIPINTLSRRLTGYSPFLVTELAALADLLDVPLPQLLTPTGDAA